MSETAAPIHPLDGEQLRTIAKLAKSILTRTGNPRGVYPSTLWRWIRHGVRGPDGNRTKLEAIAIGSVTYSSIEALKRFLAKLNAPAVADPAIATAGQRQREERRAAQRAEKAGQKLARLGV